MATWSNDWTGTCVADLKGIIAMLCEQTTAAFKLTWPANTPGWGMGAGDPEYPTEEYLEDMLIQDAVANYIATSAHNPIGNTGNELRAAQAIDSTVLTIHNREDYVRGDPEDIAGLLFSALRFNRVYDHTKLARYPKRAGNLQPSDRDYALDTTEWERARGYNYDTPMDRQAAWAAAFSASYVGEASDPYSNNAAYLLWEEDSVDIMRVTRTFTRDFTKEFTEASIFASVLDGFSITAGRRDGGSFPADGTNLKFSIDGAAVTKQCTSNRWEFDAGDFSLGTWPADAGETMVLELKYHADYPGEVIPMPWTVPPVTLYLDISPELPYSYT